MATVQSLVDQVLNDAAIDATTAQALGAINERHKELVGIARAAQAGQAQATFTATLPADAVVGDNLTTLQIDADLYPALVDGAIATLLLRQDARSDVAAIFEERFQTAAERMRQRINQRYVTQTADSVQTLLNEAVAAEGFEATQSQLLIWFNRRHREMVAYAKGAEAGVSAASFLAALPTDVAAGAATSTLAVDPDCYNGLISGVIADGLLRHGKDPELAERYEQKFREAAERMRARTEQRYLTQTTDSVQTLLNEAISAAGFDATQIQLLLWLNRRHKEMVAEARAYRDRMSILTVAGVNFYPVADVVETYAVEVGGIPYSKGRRNDVYANSQGALTWIGDGGFVVEDTDASAAQGFTLIPVPDTDGTAIDIWAAILPPTVVAGDAATALKVDADCLDGLIAGVIATGLLRNGRADLAAPHEQIFQETTTRLKRRVTSRYNTAGPAQIRIIGINA